MSASNFSIICNVFCIFLHFPDRTQLSTPISNRKTQPSVIIPRAAFFRFNCILTKQRFLHSRVRALFEHAAHRHAAAADQRTGEKRQCRHKPSPNSGTAMRAGSDSSKFSAGMRRTIGIEQVEHRQSPSISTMPGRIQPLPRLLRLLGAPSAQQSHRNTRKPCRCQCKRRPPALPRLR